ncbi:hypothetical protein [Novosphingobium sp. MMS21-SN21R]|uniref:hypothetical protein n=1 Tax=Novosphingobium sp. MMS21-SN21R TaxID=2969298 RepID=UPI002885CE7B|nr:hypothetical protein [Novosphingobium sp. MMS21-SN21R]MDT0508591.1 hypothetical protein [Novosphingobium sp. MMS21-SN21R]
MPTLSKFYKEIMPSIGDQRWITCHPALRIYKKEVTSPRPSAFARTADWLGSKIAIICMVNVSIALLSIALDSRHGLAMYIAAALMFLIAQMFIVRWMFGRGMRSITDLGFGSNRQAFKYGLSMKGFDRGLLVAALYSFGVTLFIGFLDSGQTVSGAMLLSFASFGAVTQAMRLNRFWPADAAQRGSK